MAGTKILIQLKDDNGKIPDGFVGFVVISSVVCLGEVMSIADQGNNGPTMADNGPTMADSVSVLQGNIQRGH